MKNFFKNRIWVIEKDAVIAEGYAHLINGNEKLFVAGTCAGLSLDCAELKGQNFDVIVLDVLHQSPEIIQKLSVKYPASKILIYTLVEDDQTIFDAFRAGASGYVVKDNFHELITALLELVKGGAPMSARIARKVVESYRINSNSNLTKREVEILNLLAVGNTYTQISMRLHIARDTSKKHIANIYQKLSVKCKSDAIRTAVANRLISTF
jgi:DNA-binding NarL/FixJ family response regulator